VDPLILNFCDESPGDDVPAEEIDSFLKYLTKSREDWQVNQANEATFYRFVEY